MTRRYAACMVALLVFCGSRGFADDLSIYGQSADGVKPNCLIIFDTSGSMAREDVPLNPYSYETTYAGDYDSTAWYYDVSTTARECVKRGRRWKCRNVTTVTTTLGGYVSDIACEDISSDVNEFGQYFSGDWCLPVDGTVGGPVCPLTSGGCEDGYSLQDITLSSGNYLNYEASPLASDTQSRIAAAKDVITDIVNDNYDKANFGLMRFDGSNSGYLLSPCGASKESLLASIDGLVADGYTPLAETLAEAGRYFAGMSTWYGKTYSDTDIYNGGTYVSPIDYSCQQDHIILLTDGQPTSDGYKISTDIETYMNNETIGSTRDLPAVAAFLNRTDMCDTYPDSQVVITSTIAFGNDISSLEARQFLEDTASAGGGTFSVTSTSTGLANAFNSMIDNMLKEVSIFVAPVVPINKTRRTSDSDLIYLAFFKPQASGGWKGNIKKFNLVTKENCGENSLCDEIGEIYDVNWTKAVTANGTLATNAVDYWNTNPGDVTGSIDEGGVGDPLAKTGSDTRNLYTYIESCTDALTGDLSTLNDSHLTSSTNQFSKTNDCLLSSPYGLTETQIDMVHKNGRDWKMGDVVHAEPVVANYQDDSLTTVIFAGSNDAVFHCFSDVDGRELWGFVPPDQFSRIGLIDDNDNHSFIDGGITATYSEPKLEDGMLVEGSPRTVIFGERRGGTSFFALNIETMDSPQYLYEIPKNYFEQYADSYEELGQSWGRPVSGKISTGIDRDTGNAVKTDAFVITGGYDAGQDEEAPAADNTGRVVFIVNELTGDLIYGLGNMSLPQSSEYNFRTVTEMKHCVTEVLATYGTTYNGANADILNRLYFGDLGGNVFAAADDLTIDTVESEEGTEEQVAVKTLSNGSWSLFKQIFKAEDGSGRKILYAPVMTERDCDHKEVVLFGTGDREHPNDETVTNRFYCVVNDWTSSTALTDDDLADVTDANRDGERVPTSHGWYINLGAGEKVVSKPIVYGDLVIFTTYTPPSDSETASTGDPCDSGAARGKGRLYTLSICDASGEEGEEDRIKELDDDLPMAQPMLNDDQVRTGTTFETLKLKKRNDYFYWRQL